MRKLSERLGCLLAFGLGTAVLFGGWAAPVGHAGRRLATAAVASDGAGAANASQDAAGAARGAAVAEQQEKQNAGSAGAAAPPTQDAAAAATDSAAGARGAAAAKHGALTAEQLSALQRRVQQRLDELQKERGFPGATAAFVTPDGREVTLAAGLADVETKRAMQPDDRMLAGSTGKTFFGAVLLKLVEQNKLELDAKIEKYLGQEPWFSRLPNARDITVRMLMNHTSGIPEYAESEEFTSALLKNPDKVWTPVEILEFVFDKKGLFPAGKGWSYADTNYFVLGVIGEKILKQTMYAAIEEQVLRPLQLAHTSPSTSRTLPGLITGYGMPHSPFKFEGGNLHDGKFLFNPQFEWAGGGFISNSPDLARWAMDLYAGNVLRKSTIAEMLRSAVPAETGPGDKYGLGVQVWQSELGISYGHSGWFPGYLTEMEYFPDYGVSIAIQLNTDDFAKMKGTTHAPLLALAKEILPEFPKRASEAP